MAMTPHLLENDTRALVRLIAGAPPSTIGIELARNRVFEGLRSIVQASAWTWAHVSRPEPKGSLHITRKQSFGDHHEPLDAVLSSHWSSSNGDHSNPPAWDPADSKTAGAGAMERSMEFFLNERFILSLQPLGLSDVSLIAFSRAPSQPVFTTRERWIVQTLTTDLRWLHGLSQKSTAPGKNTLPPRKKTILDLLVAGRSRNEIVEELEISPHTVGGYIKEIYAMFSVRSQAELMAHFLRGEPAAIATAAISEALPHTPKPQLH